MYNGNSQAARLDDDTFQQIIRARSPQIHTPIEQSIEDNEEAEAALGFLQLDIVTVGAAEHSRDNELALTLQRRAIRCAARAFRARGDYNHPAWSTLVAAIRALLRHRLRFADGHDDTERARLIAFVDENARGNEIADRHGVG